MSAGLVSCIVTVYNGERFLAEALESVLDQSYAERECIVVDDGSTDGTSDVIDRYRRFVCAVSQPNAGTGAALNTGVRHARGRYLAFLDYDDIWHYAKLERQVAAFEANGDLQWCVARVRNFVDEAARPPGGIYPGVDLEAALPGYVPGTLMVRRTVFDRTGPFSTDPHTAAPRWFVALRGLDLPATALDEVLLYRRVHDRNQSYSNAAESSREHLRFLRELVHRRRRAQ